MEAYLNLANLLVYPLVSAVQNRLEKWVCEARELESQANPPCNNPDLVLNK